MPSTGLSLDARRTISPVNSPRPSTALLIQTPIFEYHFGMKTTIDAAGRVVVPKALRDRLALAPGTEIEIEAVAVADGVSVRPTATGPALVLEAGVLIHRGGGRAAVDVVEFLRQQRAGRAQAPDGP